jgi:hypothetical protein
MNNREHKSSSSSSRDRCTPHRFIAYNSNSLQTALGGHSGCVLFGSSHSPRISSPTLPTTPYSTSWPCQGGTCTALKRGRRIKDRFERYSRVEFPLLCFLALPRWDFSQPSNEAEGSSTALERYPRVEWSIPEARGPGRRQPTRRHAQSHQTGRNRSFALCCSDSGQRIGCSVVMATESAVEALRAKNPTGTPSPFESAPGLRKGGLPPEDTLLDQTGGRCRSRCLVL